MLSRLGSLARMVVLAAIYSTAGAAIVLVVVFIVYLNGRPDLSVWHLADLDEEFRAGAGVNTFRDYLALEERLFQQLDELVYAKIPSDRKTEINRYNRGSLSDPARWKPDWNRSFELTTKSPKVGVLLLHGMSDSPYSLRQLGQRLNAAGAQVIGLRMPGHGTAPSGLVEITWQDMAAATRLAMRHLAEKVGNRPIYIVGYSTGAALAVHYALAALEDETLPRAERLALVSPAIGVSSLAALAVWQGRIGHLLGLEKLAWNVILPEYDPFKYGSFAVNAGDVVYRLTNEIQESITALDKAGKLGGLPRILAFSSVVDATVSTPALVSGLYERLPASGHELVLFDINRVTDMEALMKRDPDDVIQAVKQGSGQTFTLSVVANETEQSREVIMVTKSPGNEVPTFSRLGLSWPDDVYSLAHVALPFPPNDPVYGGPSAGKSPGIRLGNIALRGERGALEVAASDMLRLRWNPFYAFVEARLLEFVGLGDPQESVQQP
ncbi:MAG: lysophospholipase [Gammaproteobacteria bacterium]|nr:lysophospholipase [Gammaproteobacteria bacterium]